jgi:hypothetical protein
MSRTSDVFECLGGAVREVLADPTLSNEDLVGILEDLLPGEDITEDIRHPGDRWTPPPSRRIVRCGAWIGFGAGEPNCWMGCDCRLLTCGTSTTGCPPCY